MLKPVEGFAFVDDAITPPTKSASNTMAAFGGVANAFVTDWLKLYWRAPLVPPAMFGVSPRIFPIDEAYAGANRKRIVERWVNEVLNLKE